MQRQVQKQYQKQSKKQKPDPYENIQIKKRGNVFFIVNREKSRSFKHSWRMIFTLVLILMGGLASALAASQITSIQRQLDNSRGQLREQHEINTALARQLETHYTLDEIEIRARELGMDMPESSQVFRIDVPRLGYTIMNTSDDVFSPTNNYFLQDMWAFITGLYNRLFGG